RGAEGAGAAAGGEPGPALRQRDPAGGERTFRQGARPSPNEVMAMVEAHGERFGAEPICRALGYKSASVVYARRHRPPSPRSQDEEILAEIHGVRKGYAAVPSYARLKPRRYVYQDHCAFGIAAIDLCAVVARLMT